MTKRFEDIQVDDQLEMPAHRDTVIWGEGENLNPERVVQVAIVTHIWFDPVEEREYVALAKLRNNGSYGKPTEKRTIRGLAQCGWRKSKQDWIKKLAAIKAGNNVLPMFGRRVQ